MRVGILGATGSVGSATLDICRRFPDRFRVTALAARSNGKALLALGRELQAEALCLTAPGEAFSPDPETRFYRGTRGLLDLVETEQVDHWVFASSGTDAIEALVQAIRLDRDVSLANKESIVVAGPWVLPELRRPDQLRPVDSEHSALWQCLHGEPTLRLRQLWLTASGGPFRDLPLDRFDAVTPQTALAHPVWRMGPKITVDSATLVNKGIECIEAMRLFAQPMEKVGALIHPRSQVHGLALFQDGSCKLLLSSADMRLPAAAALAYPDRLPLLGQGFDFPGPEMWDLRFEPVDPIRFPGFTVACRAGQEDGPYPALLVGADEVAVDAFLSERIPFVRIAAVLDQVLSSYDGPAPASLADAVDLVEQGRRRARSLCGIPEEVRLR